MPAEAAPSSSTFDGRHPSVSRDPREITIVCGTAGFVRVVSHRRLSLDSAPLRWDAAERSGTSRTRGARTLKRIPHEPGAPRHSPQ